MAYNRFEVPTLARTPLPWSLLNIAEDVTPSGDGSDRWVSGVTWKNGESPAVRSWESLSLTPGDKNLVYDPDPEGTFDPVVLYLPYQCPTSGPTTDEDVNEAKTRLEYGTPAAAEAVFWNWAMSNATNIGVTGTTGEIVAALSQKMAMDGATAQNVIHMPMWAGEMYLKDRKNDDAPPLTGSGNLVVVGAGYPHVGSLGSHQIIMATGPVGYMLSGIEVIESPAHIVGGNTRITLVERYLSFQIEQAPIYFGVAKAGASGNGGSGGGGDIDGGNA